MSTLKPLKKPPTKGQARRVGSTEGGAAARRRARAAPPPPQRTPLRLFYGLLGAIAVIGAVVLFARARDVAPPPSDVPVDAAVRPLSAPTGTTPEGFWFKGRPDAPVTVLVYSDFQCPSCATAFRLVEGQLDRDYVETGRVRYVYHDFPLPSHANAVPSATAARCAGEQDRFWPMHDLLFSRQREWTTDRDPARRFAGYAGELGLDRGAFERCQGGDTYAAPLRQAATAATRAGIGGTPTFVVDGRQVETPDLIAAVEAALRAKGQ